MSGLGSIGVGVYGGLGAITNDRKFYFVTMLLRLTFATIQLSQWGWDENSAVICYEVIVAALAGVAALT
jgi:hypothetical protein